MYYIKAIVLENCPYGQALVSLLDKNKIQHEITWVNHNNKENYKTSEINTFPQVYLNKKNNNGSLLLGGYNDFKNIFDSFHNKDYNSSDIAKYSQKYSFSKKTTLRLVQLVNSLL